MTRTALVLLFASLGVPVATPPAAQSPPPLIAEADRRAVPLDWRVRTADGQDVDVASFAGRPLFVNLWATWCAPCVAELASIAALRDSLAARGADDVVFLLVSPERASRVRDFARRRGTTLPLAVELDPLPAVLGIRAVPSTWLIGRDGRIVAAQRGAVPWDAPAFVDFVFRALP